MYEDIGIITNDEDNYELTDSFYELLDAYCREHFVLEKEDARFHLNNFEKTSGTIGYSFVVPQTLENWDKELRNSGVDPERLDGVLSNKGETFNQLLFRLLDERKITDKQFKARANISRQFFHKIHDEDYHPRKPTAIIFAIALGLDLEELEDFLTVAGYSLSMSRQDDLIIRYFFEEQIYDLYLLNIALQSKGLKPLKIS